MSDRGMQYVLQTHLERLFGDTVVVELVDVGFEDGQAWVEVIGTQAGPPYLRVRIKGAGPSIYAAYKDTAYRIREYVSLLGDIGSGELSDEMA